jgi:hypothetical protein
MGVKERLKFQIPAAQERAAKIGSGTLLIL